MSLSNLIVQRAIASVREVEEALARQVLYGGDLVTNLLEVCRLDEAALLPLVAASLGLPPAPPGELPPAPPEAQRLVAAEVAAERGLVPLDVGADGLTVAVAAPLAEEVEQELSFALAMPIAQRIAPLVRIRQALQRDYGVPLERRLERLLQRMLAPGAAEEAKVPPAGERRLSAPRPPSQAVSGSASLAPRPARPSVPLAGDAATLLRAVDLASARLPRRRRGALTVEAARAELEEVDDRDAIIELLFDFARQYFDYTAVFIVHGEVAEGRDAFGEGAAREQVARLGVPLDLPSMLASAREARAMQRRVPSPDGLDAVLMRDLGRSGATPCAVFPVVVRTRVVAFLLGDGGEVGSDAVTLADVQGVVALATAAFERLIVRRKFEGSMRPPSPGSLAPGRPSLAPATRVSAAPKAERPSVDELAPSIRELLADPASSRGATLGDPVVEAVLPPDDDPAAVRWRGASSSPPSDDDAPEVRVPSSPPLPREQAAPPEREPAVTFPSNLGAAAAEAIAAVGAGPRASGSSGSMPAVADPARRPARRRQAPALDFEAVPPSSSSSVFGASFVQASHPSSAAPPSAEPEPPPSPKAESPPPQPVAAPSPDTGTSPLAVEGPPPSPAAVEVPSAAATDVTGVEVEEAPLQEARDAPSPRAATLALEEEELPPPDQRDTPLAPPVASSEIASWPPTRPTSKDFGIPSIPAVPPSSTRAMPISEQQISVPLHHPPSARSQPVEPLPSIIVDVASEYVGLVQRVLDGDAEDAETELLRLGGAAMPAIMSAFPGPLTIEVEQLMVGALPRVADCGPVLRLVARQRHTALPFVLSHIEDPDVDKRFWATYLLTELVYPDVLEPVLERVFDDELRVRRVARAAARAFAEVQPAILVERLELVAMDGGEPRPRRVQAVEALGETREALAVPALVPLLDDPDAEVVSAVRSALVLLTRQDFGASSAAWRAWWAEAKERHRLEWLIDALMHEQATLRGAAGEELKTLTREYFGFFEDLTKRERERAQARFREWWTTIGRVRFSRSTRA